MFWLRNKKIKFLLHTLNQSPATSTHKDGVQMKTGAKLYDSSSFSSCAYIFQECLNAHAIKSKPHEIVVWLPDDLFKM